METQYTPGDDIIDLRNVEREYANLLDQPDEDMTDEDREYIAQVEDMQSEFGDWQAAIQNDPTMISDNYFEAYARDFAVSIGAIESESGWPIDNIDWEEAASDLQMDYTSITFGDTEYWSR